VTAVARASLGDVTGSESVVATVCELATTPVKGLRLQSRSAVTLGRLGVAENRRFYLIDERCRMVNGKQIGVLSAVVASYDNDGRHLTMTFPDGEVVSGTVAPAGPVLTRFFSRELPAELVAGPWSDALSAHTGRALRLVEAVSDNTGLDRGRAGTVSLISRASVARLARLADAHVDPRRFRMLVQVDGIAAHAEDAWVGSMIRIGGALVGIRGHVGRCLVTGQDPDTGVKDLPTLELLRSYRQGLPTTEPLAFGVYGEVLEPGRVHVGDRVQPAG
jgi:hypothetical protein